ncbi:ubiquitin-specific protease 5 [Prunus dulcis]|uniref:Ubiquitin-specific protease 5 n=1 Tax=Prunus dulcis TaxID=3755 RepID=A0A4Y1RYH4_PRUDU|nr:ubiquitin-specific protease 5 [Prunus dulcis]
MSLAENLYRPDLKKAAFARVSVGHRSLKVSKSGVKKRNRKVVKTLGRNKELLHYELVYNYSGSKHIEQKAVEKLSTKSNRETINGKEIDLEELGGRVDQAQIQKHYKITSVELGISSLADAITLLDGLPLVMPCEKNETYISISGDDASSFYYVHLVKCKI